MNKRTVKDPPAPAEEVHLLKIAAKASARTFESNTDSDDSTYFWSAVQLQRAIDDVLEAKYPGRRDGR